MPDVILAMTDSKAKSLRDKLEKMGRKAITMMDFLLEDAKDFSVLEIGPLHNPYFKGTNVKYMDVLDAQGGLLFIIIRSAFFSACCIVITGIPPMILPTLSGLRSRRPKILKSERYGKKSAVRNPIPYNTILFSLKARNFCKNKSSSD